TRLGVPLPAPDGKGLATLAQLKAQPELLKPLSVDDKHPYDLTPAQARGAEAYLACSLTALSKRMDYLEKKLTDSSRARLAIDPAALAPRFQEAVGGPVKGWNPPGNPRTPARVLRQGLSPQDGGTDPFQRALWLQANRSPWRVVVRSFFNDLPDLAQGPVKGYVDELYKQYVQVPHGYLVRGRHDEAIKRLMRIRDELEHQGGAEGKAWDEQRRQWSERVRDAYVTLSRAQATPGMDVRKAERQVQNLWSDDKYLQGLALVVDEVELKEYPKKFLTPLILQAVTEPLGGEASYLLALSLHEKAE